MNIDNINNEINTKIKKVFNGISTKDLKKNIKQLNNNIKYDYTQMGGLINLYIQNELKKIHDMINSVSAAPLQPDAIAVSILQHLSQTVTDKSSGGDKIGYDKLTDRYVISWLIDDLNELVIDDLNATNKSPDEVKIIQEINKYIEDIHKFLHKNKSIFENQIIKSQLDKDFQNYFEKLILKFKYFNDVNNETNESLKNAKIDYVKKESYDNLIKPDKQAFNLLASMRFNKFYKYSNKNTLEDNSKKASGQNYAEDDATKETILEQHVFNEIENTNFQNAVTNIIEFAIEKIGSDKNRNDKNKIIILLNKIKDIDIKMNTIFSDNVKIVRNELKKKSSDDLAKQKEYKKTRNDFIQNLVKLQNSLFQFQIRIIFTQITQINNIINRRLLIIEDDKNKFMTQINNLLDIVNQKVNIMNEYIESTTDENKNIVPLIKEYKYDEYEYTIDPETKHKDIIRRAENKSADELSEPAKSVLSEINDYKKNNIDFNSQFPSAVRDKLINDSGDPDFDKDPNIKALAPTISSTTDNLTLPSKYSTLNSLIITQSDGLTQIAQKITPPSALKLPLEFNSLSTIIGGTIPIPIQTKTDMMTTLNFSKSALISEDITGNINKYIITNFYLINKISLYIFNNNVIKQIMLLFLKPNILYTFLDTANFSPDEIFQFINCFFIRIININPHINVLSIENIKKYIKNNSYFKQLNYLHDHLNPEYIYNNTLIFYNLIHYTIDNGKIYEDDFEKIVNLRYIFYFIPYLLKNINKCLYNIDFNDNLFLKNIIEIYLDEIYHKLLLLNIFIKKLTSKSKEVFDTILHNLHYPVLVNLIKNISINETAAKIYNKNIPITTKYKTIIKGYDADNLPLPPGGDEIDFYQNITRYNLKNPKIITEDITPGVANIHELDITYINYNDRLNTYNYRHYSASSTGGSVPHSDSKTKSPFPSFINDFTVNGIDNNLNVNKYKFGSFANIYEINKKDVLDTSSPAKMRDIIDLIKYHKYRDNIILIGLGISGSGKTTYLIGNDTNPGPGILIRYNDHMILQKYKIEIKGIEIKSLYNNTQSFYDVKDDTIEIDDVSNKKIKEINDLLNNNRHVSVTPNNKESSRSEMILIIKYEHKIDKITNKTKYITLCDLAGNEVEFNNKLIYYIKNTYNKIIELQFENFNKDNPGANIDDTNFNFTLKIKFDNFYTYKIESNASINKLLTEFLLYYEEIKTFINNIQDISIKQLDEINGAHFNIEDNDKKVEIINDINIHINNNIDILINSFIDKKTFETVSKVKPHKVFINSYYTAIKNIINYMFIYDKLYTYTDFTNKIKEIITMLTNIRDNSDKIDKIKLQNSIINIYKNTYDANEQPIKETELKKNMKKTPILDTFKNINISQHLVLYILLLLEYSTASESNNYSVSEEVIKDDARINPATNVEENILIYFNTDIYNLINNLNIENDSHNIYFLYFSQKYLKHIISTSTSKYTYAHFIDTYYLEFNFNDFITYLINIFRYIYCIINITSYNLLLRKYEGLFINKFINDFKNDCSKLLKYQNVYNYKEMKNNLICTLSHITESHILNNNDYNNEICLLPTTNLYLDNCNTNNNLYDEINYNIVSKTISYECDIFKFFYFDNGEFKIRRENKKTPQPYEDEEKKLKDLQKKLYNEKSMILIETVINLYDWPQFNEFSIPYININHIKKLYNIIKIFNNNKIILQFNDVIIIEKITNIINIYIAELKTLLEKYDAYNGFDIFIYIKDIQKKIVEIMNSNKQTQNNTSFIISTTNTFMHEIQDKLELIIIKINEMNNLTIINSIDTKNILENNHFNAICSYKEYNSPDIENFTFDPLGVINTITDEYDINIEKILEDMVGKITSIGTYIKKIFTEYTNVPSNSFTLDGKDLDQLNKDDHYLPPLINKFENQYPTHT
jgi:hypothetical protein